MLNEVFLTYNEQILPFIKDQSKIESLLYEIKTRNMNRAIKRLFVAGTKILCGKQPFLFFISVMLGTLLVTMLSKEKYPENTMMSKLVATDILTKGWNKQELLIYCLMKRIKEFGVLFLFSCTVFRKLCFGISTILIGVGLGILLKLFFLFSIIYHPLKI